MSGGGGNPLTQYVVPGLEAVGGAVSEYFAPGNPVGISLIGSGAGQLAGGAAGGSQGQSSGGMLGSLGGMLGGGAGLFGGGAQAPASGGMAGIGAGTMPGTGGFGGWGTLANGAAAPPPAMASAAGGAAPTTPTPGNLAPSGGGPSTYTANGQTYTMPSGAPAPVPALPPGATGGGGEGQYYWDGQNWTLSNDPPSDYATTAANAGYSPTAAAALQGTGAVGEAYLKYLAANDKTELAKPFQSTVIPQQLNALAGVKSSPITPPSLTV